MTGAKLHQLIISNKEADFKEKYVNLSRKKGHIIKKKEEFEQKEQAAFCRGFSRCRIIFRAMIPDGFWASGVLPVARKNNLVDEDKKDKKGSILQENGLAWGKQFSRGQMSYIAEKKSPIRLFQT